MAEREYNFGPGNPDPGVFPAQDLGAAAQRVLNRLGTELAHYPDPLGLPELRAVAAERFERNQGIRPALEDIVITNGAMQSLVLSAQGLARPGDSVVMEEFEYCGTIRVFKQHGLQLVGVALDDEGMRMDALEQVLASQSPKPAFIYTTSSYQNPTGTTLPRERREGLLNDLAVVTHLQRYDLEHIGVPTLVVSARDDLWGTYESAVYTAQHIPEARFLGLPDGGHLWVGRHREVMGEIAGFLTQSAR